MKKKTFNKLIQGPLRFHHQDIHEELNDIKSLLTKILIKLDNSEKKPEPEIKHELNNTNLKWNNEYKFVPASQSEELVLRCDGYSTSED